MTRTIPFDILEPFLVREEGLKLRAYKDGGGVLTIGCGHTGPNVRFGAVWTQEQVDDALKADLASAAMKLAAACDHSPHLASLSDHQYAALLSFVFNLGAGRTWGIWREIKNGHLANVPAQMARFVFDNGKRVQGLVNRRAAEIALWHGPDKGHAVIA